MGLFINLGSGAIAYKCKLQPTVATSSTEAEFLAVVFAAKMVLSIWMILTWSGLHSEKDPTVLYVDSQATINIVNKNQPTPQAGHVEAIQEWRERELVQLSLIAPGVINPANAETKSLSGVLHLRHVRRAMGTILPFILN